MLNAIAPVQAQQYDTATIMGNLYGDGIVGLKGAFEREWVQALHEDIEGLYQDALQLTKKYYETLPDVVRQHLTCRIVETLEPIVQAHTIEGLMMGDA